MRAEQRQHSDAGGDPSRHDPDRQDRTAEARLSEFDFVEGFYTPIRGGGYATKDE